MHALESQVRRVADPLGAPHAPPPGGHRPAAVLLLLDAREEGLPLLFLERTAHLRHHAGQIAFPGGVAESSDGSMVDTALREAREEAGIPPESVEVVGLLPPFLTATSDRWLTPVIGIQHHAIALTPDPYEVARLFTIPLAALAAAPHTLRRLERDGRAHDVHFYRLGDDVVWGVTAAIVHELLDRIARSTLGDVSGSGDAPRTG